jgi:TP901 family phage tail tape measure protein
MADIQSNIDVNIDTSAAVANLRSLQRQISAFYTSLSSAGSAANGSIANMQQNLLNTINATGQFSAQLTKVQSTADSFTSSLEKNKLSLGQYFRYAGGASQTFSRMFKTEADVIDKTARERVKDLQTQYVRLGKNASGAIEAIKIRPLSLDMDHLATRTALAAQKQQLLNQLLRQGSTQLLNFGKNTQWAGRQLMVGFTIPLSMLGTAAAKTFMDMEKQAIAFKRVYGDAFTTTAETAQALQSIRDLATEFTKYGVAAEQTMELAARAAAAGKTGAELTAQVREANRLAVLGQVEQSQALETTMSITNAFGTATADLTKKINFLNAVENQTVTSIEDLTIAVPKAGPVIKQLGGDVEDLAFFLTAMKEGGINASEGANALKSGLASLINPTEKSSAFLKGFGINVQGIVDANKGDVKGIVIDFAKALDTLDPLNRARAIEQMFGKFQFARLSTLFQNVIADGTQASKVLELTGRSASELAGLASKELGTIAASSMFKFQKSVEDLRVQLAPLGETFLKIVTPMISGIADILENFNKMDDRVKTFITGLVLVVGGLGPVLLMTFGLLANGVANIIKGFTLVRNLFNKTGDSSRFLGEQTDYMTQQQLEASAAASSLEQVHQKLEQRFTSEAIAINKLTAALQKAVTTQNAYKGMNTGRPAAVKKFANGGMVRGPGGPKDDLIPADLSNGEAVIDAETVRKNPRIIQALFAKKKIIIPGYKENNSSDFNVPVWKAKKTSDLYKAPPAVKSQTVIMTWATELAESAAAETAAKIVMAQAGVEQGKIDSAVANLIKKQASHIMPDVSPLNVGGAEIEVKNWRAKNLVPDLGYVNNYIDTLRKNSSIVENFSKTNLDTVAKELGMSMEDVQKELDNLKKGIQRPTRRAASVLQRVAQSDPGYQGQAAAAGLKVRLAGDYYETMDQRQYDPAQDPKSAAQTQGRVKRFAKTLFDRELPSDTKNIVVNAVTNRLEDVDRAIAETAAKKTRATPTRTGGRSRGASPAIMMGPAAAVVEQNNQTVSRGTRNMDALNNRVQKLSFGVMALSGVFSMFGDGPMAEISGAIMGVTGAFYALSTVLEVFRGVNLVAIATQRAKNAMDVGRAATSGITTAIDTAATASLLRRGGALPKSGGIFSKFTGFISKIIPALARFGAGLFGVIRGIAAFLGPVGLVIGGLTTLWGVISFITGEEEKRQDRLNGFSEAVDVSSEKLKGWTDLLGIEKVLTASEQAAAGITPGTSSKVSTAAMDFTENEDFASEEKGFGVQIKALRDATQAEANQILASVSLRLLSQNATSEQIDAVIQAIQMEADRRDINVQFKSIDFSTKEGREGIVKNAKTLLSAFQSEFNKGRYKVEWSGNVKKLVPTSENLTAAAAETAATLFNNLDSLFTMQDQGLISGEEFNSLYSRMQLQLKNTAGSAIVMNGVMAKLAAGFPDTEFATLLQSVSGLDNQMFVFQLTMNGLIKTGAQLGQVLADLDTVANKATLPAATVKAAQARLDAYAKQVVAATAASNDLYRQNQQTNSGAEKQKTAFEEARDSLKNNIKDTYNSVTAYNKLTRSGMDAASAAKIAADATLAAAFATTKIGTKKWKELVRLAKEYNDVINAGLGKTDEERIKDSIGLIMDKINAQENVIELEFKLKTKADEDIIKNAQNQINALQFQEDDYEAGLTRLEDKEQAINDTYDKRLETLDEIEEASRRIAEQKNSELSISQALARGDVASAAAAIQQEQQRQAEEAFALKRQSIEKERAAKLAGLTVDVTVDGNTVTLTREQIEKRVKDIKQQIFEIEEKTIEPAQERIRLEEIKKDQAIASIKYLGLTKLEWETVAARITRAETNTDLYNKKIEYGINLLKKHKEYWEGLSQIDFTDTPDPTVKDPKVGGGSDAGGASGGASSGSGSTGNGQTAQQQAAVNSRYYDMLSKRGIFKKEDLDAYFKEYFPRQDTLSETFFEKSAGRINPQFQKIFRAIENAQAFDNSSGGTGLDGNSYTLKHGIPLVSSYRQPDGKTKQLEPNKFATTADALYQAVANKSLLVEGFKFYEPQRKATYTISEVMKTMGVVDRYIVQKLAKGGMVMPQKFMSGGFASGTDTVPAMLTPGEFVMSKYAVDSYGLDTMKSINSGTISDGSVYNSYSVNVNVRSDANPDQIARAVMGQIRQVNSQQLRGNRF